MAPSGERLVPDDAVEVSLQEHLARYRFARERARGGILDVACGAGYGSAMLGAVGADVDAAALRYAARRHRGRYVAADALRLPFGRAFDTVVSFETVEHVPDPERFVSECVRVLRPGGRLIISTPNREVWSPHSARPFLRHHLREFNRREFLALLRPLRVELYCQLPMGRGAAAAFILKEMGKRLVRAFVPIRRFRPGRGRKIEEFVPDPAFDVVPCGSCVPAVFVAVAEPL